MGWLKSWLVAPFRTPARRRTISSLIGSTLVHAGLLAACTLWLLIESPQPQTVAIRTTWQESAPPVVTPLEPLPVTTLPDKTAAGGSSQGQAVFRQTDGPHGESVALDVAQLSALDTTGQLPIPVSPATQTVGLASGQGVGLTSAQGRGGDAGNGEGDATGGGFFGLTAEGRRVVYVVDASRSMNHPFPGPMKTRFGRVKLELVRSISGMTREQEFFIVYFNDQAWPMPANTLALAVPSAQQKYLRWAVEAKASGTTDPEQALLVALRLNPDVIYFLTDGAFKPRVVDRVRQANQRARVAIHTIGFGDDEGETLLEEIAFQNGGTYQFIPGEEAEGAPVAD